MAYELTPTQWRELRVQRTAARPPRLCIINRKGGSGKTTTAVHLAAAFAAWGLRTRITDGDPQLASVTFWLPPQAPGGFRTLLDVFNGDARLAEVTYPTTIPGVFIVPSLETLLRVESERPPGTDSLMREEYEADADRIDVEIGDSAPSLGLVTVSMLAAADNVAVLVNTSVLDQVGAAEMDKPLSLIKRRLNPGMEYTAVIMCDDDERTVLSRTLYAQFQADYPGALVHQIPHSVRIREVPGAHQAIYSYEPTSPAAFAYWNLAAALVPRLGLEWKVSPEQVTA